MIQRVRPQDLQRELERHGNRVRVVQDPATAKLQDAGQEKVEDVQVDDRGPRLFSNDGSWRYPRGWAGLTPTCKEVLVQQAAKRNRGKKEQFDILVKKYFAKIADDELQTEYKQVEEEWRSDEEAKWTSALNRLQDSNKAVELSLEQALHLQTMLIEKFKHPAFRRKLTVLRSEHGENSSRLNSARHEMVSDVYTKVLPMYGFSPTYQGVFDMRKVFSTADWSEKEEVKRHKDAISYLLYGIGDGAGLVDDDDVPEEEEELFAPAPVAEAEAPVADAASGERAEAPQARPVYRYEEAEGRCMAEQARAVPPWTPVSYEQLSANHLVKAPGMIYGLEFPFNAALMKEMGAVWLTKAFQTAETVPPDAKVTELVSVTEFVKGGAGSKFIFEVKWNKSSPNLHKKLFAKIPFPYDGKTRSDRMAMSVNQQGQEMLEINTYRLLESRFPFRIPRYYFGDISNQTTNFILITECVPYGEQEGDLKMEPAYHKFKDWELAGPAEEYYYLLIRIGANLAGAYKNGDLGPPGLLDKVFGSAGDRPVDQWGMGPKNTGLKDAEFKMKIAMGADFVTGAGKELFPPECKTPEAVNRYMTVLSKVNAYTAEARWWCNRDQDYIAWTHINLNVDNVFFWRDKKEVLDAGVLDWGGVTCDSVGYKLWWWLYSCEYDFLAANIDGLIQCLAETYEGTCGLKLSTAELKQQFILSALLQGIGVLGAVPLIYRMCPKKEWKSITHRRDPRIANDVDGTGNLRIYVGTFVTIVQMINFWDLEKVVDDWIDQFTQLSSIPKKAYYKP